MDSIHCTHPSLALGVSGIRTKVLNSHLYFMAKKEDKRSVSCSHVAIKGRKGEWFLKWQFGQNLQNEGRALFLSIYLFYICTDFF